jgi:hypothetical protein
MRRQRIKKGELFGKIFAESRRLRSIRLERALAMLDYVDSCYLAYPIGSILSLLNRAAPIKIDLGNGWIECSSFGCIHGELNMLSYRPRNHRSDCTALLGGISLPNIKRAKLI